MTIFEATLKLNIDNIKPATGKTINVMDMISDGDAFLETPCTVEDGKIYVGDMWYKDADASTFN